MKPIEFVVFDGGSSPNTPVYKISEAMQTPIVISGCEGEYEILSYSYNHASNRMTLDIQPKAKK